jgi:tRNA threonylcarbamoyladenosine biosynthesis protein TsaE
MKKKIIIKSLKEMKIYGHAVARNLRGGEVLALTGELGAGKTAFAKALAKALGIDAVVQSPTFMLMKCYPRELRRPWPKIRMFCHVDAYRVKSPHELSMIGLGEAMSDPGTVTVIEWAELVKGMIPPKAIWMDFSHGTEPTERVICLR